MEYWKSLDPDTRKKLKIAAKITVGATVGATVAVGGVVIMFPIVGFGAGGVGAGTAAAAWQSSIGATVKAGCLFAKCQSAGAAGLALKTKFLLGTTGAITANIDTLYPKRDGDNMNKCPLFLPLKPLPWTPQPSGYRLIVLLEQIDSSIDWQSSIGAAESRKTYYSYFKYLNESAIAGGKNFIGAVKEKGTASYELSKHFAEITIAAAKNAIGFNGSKS